MKNIYRRGDRFRLTCCHANRVVRLIQIGANTWFLLGEGDYNRWAEPVTFERDGFDGITRKQLIMLTGGTRGLKLRKIGNRND